MKKFPALASRNARNDDGLSNTVVTSGLANHDHLSVSFRAFGRPPRGIRQQACVIGLISKHIYIEAPKPA